MKLHRTRTKRYLGLIALTALVTLFISPSAAGQQTAPDLPKAKQTS